MLVVEAPPDALPPGVARRVDHLRQWAAESSVPCDLLPLLAAADLRRGQAHRVRRVLAAAPRVLGRTSAADAVVVVGLGAPHLLWLARRLAGAHRPVVYDACDSWWLQVGTRRRAGSARLVLPAVVGALVQGASRRPPAAYISERDRDADRSLNRGRPVVVVGPRAPAALAALEPVVGHLERLVVAADLGSFHNREGFALLLAALARCRSPRPLPVDLYGPVAPDVRSPRIRYRGWAADPVQVYRGRSGVVVLNTGGSGTPNKLVDALAAARPALVHGALAGLPSLPGCSRLTRYDDAPSLAEGIDHFSTHCFDAAAPPRALPAAGEVPAARVVAQLTAGRLTGRG